MFEPLLLCLFLLYSSVMFINYFYLFQKVYLHLFDKTFLVFILLFLQTFCHLYLLCKEENNSQDNVKFLPLHSMVLLSVIGVSTLNFLRIELYQRYQQQSKKEKHENSGMPPSYITVETDDYNHEEFLEIKQSNLSRKTCLSENILSSVYKSQSIKNLFFITQRKSEMCNTISAIFYNINFQNLAVMNHDDSIKKSSFNLELLKVNESSLDSFALVLAKNYTDIWYVDFAGRFQLLLTSSFMTIVIISCYNKFFLFVIKEFEEETQINHNCNISVLA